VAVKTVDKKIEYWEHQLLDLGMRNKMINYRETKRTTLKLTQPSFNDLYTRVAVNEETLTFQRAVDRDTDGRVFAVLSLMENMSAPLPVTVGDIKTEGSVLETQLTLKNMRAKARLALEEQGTNILYLSFGFLQWKDGKGASARVVKSPLILVPVSLTVKSINAPFTLSKHEDDIVVNPTLDYLFKTEYGIELPAFDSDKDTPEDFFTRLGEIAADHGFKIIKEASLGLLSFLKITMYNDLIRNEERIKAHPVLRAMCGDAEDANAVPEALESITGDSVSPRDCYQVMSADSSQQDAILYSKHGVSFVMQGPPGTGKSQTITNIIAEALADGKKVLFVSEKMAALQVVYRRLQDAHLGDFCLPLHSYKANKKEILEQIGANLNLNPTRVKDSAITDLEELMLIRGELNGYAKELHTPMGPLGLSCYEVYGKLEELADSPTIVFSLDDPLAIDHARLTAYTGGVKSYALAISRLGGRIKDNPWQGLIARSTGFEFKENVKNSLSSLAKALHFLSDDMARLFIWENANDRVSYKDAALFSDTLQGVLCLGILPEDIRNADDLTPFIREAGTARLLRTRRDEYKAAADKIFGERIYSFNLAAWQKDIKSAMGALGENPLLKDVTPSHAVDSPAHYASRLGALRTNLTRLSSAFDAINALLGTRLAPTLHGRNVANELKTLMERGVSVKAPLLNGNRSDIRAKLTQARTLSTEMLSLRSSILAAWQEGVFSLDSAAMLDRYQREYTGLFKGFKSDYKTDSATLCALHNPPCKKVPDDTARSLLILLNAYHGKESWLNARCDEFMAAFGSVYRGIWTEWDKAFLAVDVADRVFALLDGQISPALIAILDTDGTDEAARLAALITEAEGALADIRASGFNINPDDGAFDPALAIKAAEDGIRLLGTIAETAGYIAPCLVTVPTPIDEVFSAADSASAYIRAAEDIKAKEQEYTGLFGVLYMGDNTNWDYVYALLGNLNDIKKSPYYPSLAPAMKAEGEEKETLEDISRSMQATCHRLPGFFDPVKSLFAFGAGLEDMSVKALRDRIDACIESMEDMEAWIDYEETKERLAALGLLPFVNAVEGGEGWERIEDSFLKGFYRMWLDSALGSLGEVRRFRRNAQEKRIENFVSLDDKQLLIAQMRIREKLISSIPRDHRLLKATDEVAILNKELSKKRGIMPLRKLFKLIPNLILRLKPCLMMSPLSVSYFLETEAYSFDMVIFDEASQIFPEDAIGAIYRGKQVIIVGDSKQLPPTNFFSTASVSGEEDFDREEEDADYVVADSILEETAAALPVRTLLWHYRSKNEELIAFSNREIYGNSLITFPNNYKSAEDMGVEYVYVDNGCYEGGGKNRNVEEARRCVSLVEEHILRHPKRSLGIIAFSEKQQRVIEDAITDFRRQNPRYEWFFTDSGEEPFFVKNLENVQGDERDTIIFSICYAKDKNGKMYMRFGPLGHEGGERRLNVAVTRAKRNVKLVGSIQPSDIDLSRTSSEGVRMLRAYIEFAIGGVSALSAKKAGEDFDTVDDFCGAVADFIESHGYRVQRSLGCSKYKIDMAVESPSGDGTYIAGVECDGFSYAQAKTARDRDHTRKSVLTGMGWSLYRVWSTEWYRNPAYEGEALLAFLKEAEKGGTDPEAKSTEETKLSDIATETKLKAKKEESDPYGFERYREVSVSSVSLKAPAALANTVLSIVKAEQPVHTESVCKRIAACLPGGKVTEKVKEAVDAAIKGRLEGKVFVDSEDFLRLLPLTPVKARVPAEGEAPRPMEYIHTEEFAMAVLAIAGYSFGITEEDLATECARVFGYERKGPRIKAKTDDALKYLESKGRIKIIDGKVQLTGGTV